MYVIDNDTSYNELKGMLASGEAKIVSTVDNVIDVVINKNVIKVEINAKYSDLLKKKDDSRSLMYGKDETAGVVNISVVDNYVHIFKRVNGKIVRDVRPFRQWVLSPKNYDGFETLKGPEYYKYIKLYNQDEFEKVRAKIYQRDLYTIWNKAENYMVYSGLTYFKGMKVSDLSIVSFDIETTGLVKEAADACVLLITNTFRDTNGKETKKTFFVDDYADQQDMIEDWCGWVIDKNPDLLLGHNIVIYDIPYLDHQYRKKYGKNLPLGRAGVSLEFAERTSEFRKDGSQSYSYNKISCYGREVVDTFFLAIKSDIARKYESYGLKAIIKQEGLEKDGRTFVDAGKIKLYYDERKTNPEMWNKVVQYAEDDSDDSLKLFDLMGAYLFYSAPHIPKTFQQLLESATGSQINSMMVRGYLQKGHSIAKASEKVEYQGAISFGVPGIYRNVFKIDFAALYPSIIRQYEIYDRKKDPDGYMLQITNYFTEERLKNKRLAKETGDRFYKDLEQAQKVYANSIYGFCGGSGLNYNSPECASQITRIGREALQKTILWATSKDIKYWQNLFEEKTK